MARSVLARRMVQERLIEFRLITTGVVEVVAVIESAAVPLDLGVEVVTVARRVVASLVQPVARFFIIVHVDRENCVVAAGRLAGGGDLCAADGAAGLEIGVEVLGVVRELVFEQVRVGVIDMRRPVVAGLVVGVVLVVRRVGVRADVLPVIEPAVNYDRPRRLGNSGQ